ncbi:MAG TPA: CBS domain-containing protein [Terriglobales bacterium]|jgi:magnesium transporter|nr:CBS domain-containing protein [Terriglobales bacterium]
MANVALTELLGAPVVDPSGAVAGRVRELAIAPQEDRTRIAGVVVRTSNGDRLLLRDALQALEGRAVRSSLASSGWQAFSGNGAEGYFLLERDLLDQQIIDVHGRKVVRVNDVELEPVSVNHHIALKITGVDVGARGAVRRLLKGLPWTALRSLLEKVPPRIIPWEFVDLIETDPARRVKLRIEHSRLSKLHPADIADILEDLAPAEREAVFETLNEEVAAGALEEVDPKLQASILESLDYDRAADIVEEMDPSAAADLLADLPHETSEEILEEMGPEERETVEELLEHAEHTAAGRMTTSFLSFAPRATVADAIQALYTFEGSRETLSSFYLVDEQNKLTGAVPLVNIAMAKPTTPLKEIAAPEVISCHLETSEDEVAELFDKYNLHSLPVVDDNGELIGIITADVVINILRNVKK